MKITELSHLAIFRPILSYYRDVFDIFVIISILDQAKGALRDPRKIFLTNNLRLVKKVLSSSNFSAHMKKHENHGIVTFSYILSNFELL